MDSLISESRQLIARANTSLSELRPAIGNYVHVAHDIVLPSGVKLEKGREVRVEDFRGTQIKVVWSTPQGNSTGWIDTSSLEESLSELAAGGDIPALEDELVDLSQSLQKLKGDGTFTSQTKVHVLRQIVALAKTMQKAAEDAAAPPADLPPGAASSLNPSDADLAMASRSGDASDF